MPDYGPELFAGTAEYYARYRTQYPAELFQDIIGRFGLDGQGSLLDLGCGTGEMTVPLAGYFERVEAWDPDPEMLQVARRKLAATNLTNVTFTQASSKHLAHLSMKPRLVAMGQSFHWMDKDQVIDMLRPKLVPGGGFAVVGGESIIDSAAHNHKKRNQIIQTVVKRYLGEKRRAGKTFYKEPDETYTQLFARKGFKDIEQKTYHVTDYRTIEEMIGLLFSMSWASKAQLGERAEAFERDMREALLEYEPSGKLENRFAFHCVTVRL